MDEIFPGVLHWSAKHEGIGVPVSSYYVVPAGVVLDPIMPEAGLDALAPYGTPQQIVLTSGNHTRDADRFAAAFGAPIRTSPEGADRIGGELATEPYADGEELAPGVQAVHVGVLSPDEYALHLTGVDGGALALADGLNRYGDELGFFPDDLLGDDPGAVKRGLVERFRSLLDREFEHLLVAHGDPVVGGGKTALRDAVQRLGP